MSNTEKTGAAYIKYRAKWIEQKKTVENNRKMQPTFLTLKIYTKTIIVSHSLYMRNKILLP